MSSVLSNFLLFFLSIANFYHHPSTASSDQHNHVAMRRFFAQQLVEKLTGVNSSYSRDVTPQTDNDAPFVVHSRLFLVSIQDLRENDETLVTTLRLQLSWNDSSLEWQPSEFGGIEEIVLPPLQLWAPYVQIANSVTDITSLTHSEDFHFRVTHEGRVWYHLSGKFETRCRLKLNYYPFDYQLCPIVIEPVTHRSDEIVVQVRPDASPVSLGMYSRNPTWALLRTDGFSTIYATGRRTGFARAVFYILLSRKPNYYVQTFVVPQILLGILQLMTYFMPMKFVDRTSHATVVLLTSFLFQNQLFAHLPVTSDDDSFVQSYLNISTSVSLLTITICIFTLALIDPDEELPYWGIPAFFRTFRRRKLPKAAQTDFIDEDCRVPLPRGLRRRRVILAAFLNWFGFLTSFIVTMFFPALAMSAFAFQKPPKIPTPASHNNESYYAES